ncbi:hypothetical protein AVEN_1391-1 [Araneus ventricosus]|uniref:ZP domain-containing protein n=1 Tax=Araneus ventricosus TaxID=182803 RepID=A0A4Y2LTY4_ARAVE|nr:hypothetical protein AVEN_1391-1 [Araneus ventricosus]
MWLHFLHLTLHTVFRILDAASGQDIGRIIVNNPAISPDTEIGTVIEDDGRIEKRVEVHFSCDVVFSNSCTQQTVLVEDVFSKGRLLTSHKYRNHPELEQSCPVYPSDAAAIAQVLRPEANGHHQPQPNPSRRRHALSPVESKLQSLLYPRRKQDPTYLSSNFSSSYLWCPPVALQMLICILQI